MSRPCSRCGGTERYSQGRCKACHKIATAEYAKRNPEVGRSARHRSRLKRYGLTEQEYDALVDAQNAACAICRRPGHLQIDHNHRTERVRGLLCHRCNKGLGLFDDNLLHLDRANEYLMGALPCQQL